MSAAGPGLISRLEARRSARPHHRYKVTPKSCPTRAGGLRETADRAEALEIRTRALLSQLGISEAARPEDGPHGPELATTTLRALAIPEIVACRSRLLPEMTVFSAQADDDRTIYVGGIADAVAYEPEGSVDLIEAETYCPPTPDRGADLLPVPSPLRRDRAHCQAIHLPWC